MVPRQQSSLSTSAAVRNDVTDCRLTAERSNQLDVPTQRLRSVPPVVREAGGWISRVSRQRYVRICHRPRTGIRCWSFHRCSSLGRDMPGNCEKIANRRRPGDDARMTIRIIADSFGQDILASTHGGCRGRSGQNHRLFPSCEWPFTALSRSTFLWATWGGDAPLRPSAR